MSESKPHLYVVLYVIYFVTSSSFNMSSTTLVIFNCKNMKNNIKMV